MRFNFEKLYFQNRNTHLRLGVFRIIFSLIIIQCALGEEECLRFASEFEREFFGRELWYSKHLSLWTSLIVVFGSLNLVGLFERYTKWALAILFIPFTYYFNFHLDSIVSPIWSYTTNLPIFVFALLFSDNSAISLDSLLRKKVSGGNGDIDSFIVQFFKVFVLMMYFQSAISKVYSSGWDWFLKPEIMFFQISMQHTDIGAVFLENKAVITAISFLTGIFEFLGVFILLWSKRAYVLAAYLFHFGALVVMDIDFIFLYPLFIPIFLDLNWLASKVQEISLQFKREPEGA